MLNRTTIPQSIADSLEPRARAWNPERWRRLADSIYIPETARAYALFVMGLLVLAGTMVIHVLLSAELMHLQIQLNDVNERIAQVQRLNDNLVYGIADRSALDAIYAAALEQGYVPLEEPAYVVRDTTAPPETSTAEPGAVTAGSGEGPPASTRPADGAGGGWGDWWADYWQAVRSSGGEFLRWFRPAPGN
jgi:hypothetical protein